MAAEIYYNSQYLNRTDSDQIVQIDDNRRQNILDRADRYKMSVLKFSLPGDAINSFKIDNTDVYKVSHSFVGQTADTGDYTTITGEADLYDHQNNDIKSINDFIEVYNQTSLAAWRALLRSAATVYYSELQSGLVSSAVNQPFTAEYYDIPVTIPATTNTCDMVPGFIELSIKSVYGSSNDMLLTLELISPDGVSAVVFSGARVAQNNQLVFKDTSSNLLTNVDDDTVLSGDYKPQESFLKFNTTDRSNLAVGDWVIRLRNNNGLRDNQFDINIDEIQLKIYALPESRTTSSSSKSSMEFPRLPPSLELASDNRLQYTYDQNQTRWLKLLHTPSLYELLGFNSKKMASGLYNLQFPQVLYETNNSIVFNKFTQNTSTSYRLLDIESIEIRSSSLPCQGELSADSEDRVISSLSVSSSDLDNTLFQYVNQNLRDRSYSLLTSDGIHSINISVWVRRRSTNQAERVMIAPGRKFSISLRFQRVD